MRTLHTAAPCVGLVSPEGAPCVWWQFTAEKGMGMAGGRSWTKDWLTFNNSYFTDMGEASDPPTHLCSRPLNHTGDAVVCQGYAAELTGMRWQVSMGDDKGDTLTLPTDFALTQDAGFQSHFNEFKDQSKFFEAYAAAHAKVPSPSPTPERAQSAAHALNGLPY